jgi:hypothetical protein
VQGRHRHACASFCIHQAAISFRMVCNIHAFVRISLLDWTRSVARRSENSASSSHHRKRVKKPRVATTALSVQHGNCDLCSGPHPPDGKPRRPLERPARSALVVRAGCKLAVRAMLVVLYLIGSSGLERCWERESHEGSPTKDLPRFRLLAAVKGPC